MIVFEVKCCDGLHKMGVNEDGALRLLTHEERDDAEETLVMASLGDGHKFRCVDVMKHWSDVQSTVRDGERAARGNPDVGPRDLEKLPPELRSFLVNGYDVAKAVPAPALTSSPDGWLVRRLTFYGGGSDKFWRVLVDGRRTHYRWGRRGTQGQTKSEEHESLTHARIAAEKKIAEKLRKGYR